MPRAPLSRDGPIRFTWSPKAALVDASGRRIVAGDPGARLVAGDPGASLVAALFAAAGRGEEFCVTPQGLEIIGPAAPPGRNAFFQCATSGSTGAPRRIRRSQASWLASFAENRNRFGLGPGASVAIPGALSASLALYAAVEALCLGADTHLLHGIRPDRQLARIAGEKLQCLTATPAQIRQFAAAATARGLAPCPAMRQVLLGGGRLDAPTREVTAHLFPNAEITEFYGAAETSFIALSDATTPEGAVGRAFPGVTLAIRDAAGRPLPPATLGEIWVKSPYLFAGYARGASPDTRRADGFLTIGELGHLDAAGHLFLAGRRSRMVTIADHNVFLDAIEAALLAQSGVAQAAVIALPDRLRGHVPIGFAILKADATPDAVLAATRAELGPVAAPRRLVVLDDWPYLPSGKTDYVALLRHCPAAAAETSPP